MEWKKLGRVFVPKKKLSWMVSHAANTVAEHLRDDVFRIYFTSRDKKNRAHVAVAEIELIPPFKVISISKKPILSPGETGTFDDSGVSLSCINTIKGAKYMYYLGWNLGVTVPWRNTIGLAIYNKKKKAFERYSKAPLLDRHDADPFSISYPFVLKDKNMYRMWYGSNLKWGRTQKEMAHLIKYAESKDAIHWMREGKIALPFKNKAEYAMSRPCVIKENGMYKMWYSYRGNRYRIGYAESSDAIKWKRKDHLAGIDISKKGWDSEMVCYPFVFDHKGKRYMLYNGNEYGRTGFGLAVLVK